MSSLSCSECGASLPSTAKFCPECGGKPHSGAPTPIVVDGSLITCASCGEKVPAVAKFCPECGGKTVLGTPAPEKAPEESESCAGCHKPLSGRTLKSMGKVWHPECFQCSQCAQPIASESYTIRGTKPWCDKCVDWDKKERKAGRTPATRPVSDDERHTASAFGSSESTPALRTDKVVCRQCGQVISGAAVSYGGGYYHKTCLVCKACSQPLDPEKGFLTKDAALYHPDCLKQETPKRVCGACNKEIPGKYVSFGGKNFHPDCLVCASCKTSVVSGFAEEGGQLYCGTCIHKVTKTTTTTSVPTGQVTSGIRFDHKTGTAYKVEGASKLGQPVTAAMTSTIPATRTSSGSLGAFSPPYASEPTRRVSFGGGGGVGKITCTGCFAPMPAEAPKCGSCGKPNARKAFENRRASSVSGQAPGPSPPPAKPAPAKPTAPVRPAPVTSPTVTKPVTPVTSPVSSPPTAAVASPVTVTPPATAPVAAVRGPVTCPECDAVLKPGVKFCGECGHRF